MKKFISHIGLTIRQIEGEVRLVMPDLELPETLEGVDKDENLLNNLETIVYGWETQVSDAIEAQNRLQPKGPGPLAEIDYWKERNISLSGIFEQTKQEKVKKILEILNHVESPVSHIFENQRIDLAKLYSEAKDNVRFLSTLERHFRNICYGASFHVVSETLPSMMNALRMIWIISRHYNKDERMVPLMERIAHELAERVSKVINVKTILDFRPQEIQRLCTEARKMLIQWKDSYFKVRQKIETSGRDSRWEFDRRKLFDKTEHQSIICNELIKISVVLEEFYNIFGPELKAVTGEAKKIEDVLSRVRNLAHLIKTVKFN
jgi:dynein heavy chain, axonemal